MRYLAIDTETTGLDPDTDSVIEIAVMLRDTDDAGDERWEDSVSWDELINFQGEISAASKAVHHITEDEVRWALKNKAEAIEIIKAMTHAGKHDQPPLAVVAHHAEFDQAFMPELEFSGSWICTERLAKHLWPDAESFGLQYLRYFLEIEIDPPGAPHRALYDTLCCAALFEREVAELLLKNPEALVDPATLALWVDRSLVLTKVTFGKHAGKLWSEVDQGYLNWMINEHAKGGDKAWDRDTLNTVRHYLNQGRLPL